MKRLIYIITTFVLLLNLSVTTFSNENTGSKENLTIDFQLKDIHGKDFKLSSHRGKIILLNFFTTWCKYCNEEMELLKKINATDKYSDVIIISVANPKSQNFQDAYDYDINQINSYIKDKGISHTVLVDVDKKIFSKFSVKKFPTNFIFNKKGELVFLKEGSIDEAMFLKAIEKIKSDENDSHNR